MTQARNTHSRTATLSLGFALGLSTLALSGACNTYDPELGQTPFRCGLDSPRCPDGYECVTYSPSEEICTRIGDDPGVRPDGAPGDDGGGGGGNFVCNNDSEIEPNESLSDPTLTGIPSVQTSVRYVSLAICPSTDQDFFRFEIAVNATNVIAEIEYQANRGELSLNILDNAGSSISTALPAAGNPNILRAAIPNLPIGIYYAQVRSVEAGVQNNYSIEIITE